jgi:hypothetical protein
MPAKKEAAAPVKAAPKRTTPAKGEKLVCETCGLGIIVDEVSGVVAFEELICCGTPMKAKAAPAKKSPAAAKAPAATKSPAAAKTPAKTKAPAKKPAKK